MEDARAYFKKIGFPFSVLQDENSKLANKFKANRTPHAFLVSSEGKILYSGGITNSKEGNTAVKNYLREALLDIDNGRNVGIAQSRTLGCEIAR